MQDSSREIASRH